MTPQQALSVLDQALQPGVQLKRADWCVIQSAMEVLSKLVNPLPPPAAEVKPTNG